MKDNCIETKIHFEFLTVSEESTSRKKFHNEIEIDRVLEGVIHFHDPLMISFDKHISFRSHMCHLKYNPQSCKL